MAQPYVLIQRTTLTGNSSSVDIVGIPQNYTDLKLVITSRNTDTSSWGNILVGFNDSTTGYTNRFMQGNGGAIGTGEVAQMVGDMNTTTSTANTFNNIEVYISNYTSSANKCWYADSIATTNSTTGYQMLMSNVWANSAAINKITITNRTGGLSFVAGSTFTLYGIGGERATGGTITSDDTFKYHTFTSSGTFTALENIPGLQALVVAGGGGGGSRSGGGGGAGGLILVTPTVISAGSTYSVIVGSGGSGGSRSGDSSAGSNSGFGSFIAFGGGGGDSALGGGGSSYRNGGSGGGCSNNRFSSQGGVATQTSGLNYVGYGTAGGTSNSTSYDGGGGGGAGDRANSDASTSSLGSGGGQGGIGLRLTEWSYPTNTGSADGWYAGGGGGSSFGNNGNHGKGGLGGGGRGHDTAPVAGIANTGGGGGGCGNSANTNTTPVGAAGGSGLVIIRYPHSGY